MGEKRQYFKLLNPDQRKALREWWIGLEDTPGDRAQLRRCNSPWEVMMVPAFFRLVNRFEDLKPHRFEALAAVAGLLALVRKGDFRDDMPPIQKQLAMPAEGGNRPRMSDLRFRQLIKSRDIEELYRRFRRALALLGRKANILSLADLVLQWADENLYRTHAEPTKQFQFRMAQGYFEEMIAHEKKTAK